MKQLVLGFVFIAFSSCSREPNLNGTYISGANCFVYGLKVNKEESEVRLYVLNELSTESAQGELLKQQNWSDYKVGSMQYLQDNKWRLLGIDSDVQSFDRPLYLNIEFKEKSVKIRCKDIYDIFTGETMQLYTQFCKSDSIEFMKLN